MRRTKLTTLRLIASTLLFLRLLNAFFSGRVVHLSTILQQLHPVSPTTVSFSNNTDQGACQDRYIYVLSHLPPLFHTGLCSTLNFTPSTYSATWCVDRTFPRGNRLHLMTTDEDNNRTTSLGMPLYATRQFDLWNILHSRFTRHPCRTWNASEATLVWVPIAYGILCCLSFEPNNFLRHNKRRSRVRQAFERFFAIGQEYMRTAGNYDGFAISNNSIIVKADFMSSVQQVQAGISKVKMTSQPNSSAWNQCEGCNFVLVNHRVQRDCKLFNQRRLSRDLLNGFEANKLLLSIEGTTETTWSVPYPGHLHVDNATELTKWQQTVEIQTRPKLLTYVAGQRNHRESTIRDCRNESMCEFVECHQANQYCGNVSALRSTMLQSSFCLQTEGDTPSRQGFFDAIAMGCLPVLTDANVLHFYQRHYFDSLGVANLSSFVLVGRNVSHLVRQIRTLPDQEVQDKRRYMIWNVLPRTVYSTRVGSGDAFDLVIERLLETARRRIARYQNQSLGHR